jgi:uncharacterized protein YoxC
MIIIIIGFIFLFIAVEILLLSIDSKLDKVIEYIDKKPKRK